MDNVRKNIIGKISLCLEMLWTNTMKIRSIVIICAILFGICPMTLCAGKNTSTGKQTESNSNAEILRIENGIIPMSEIGQPQWDRTATLSERMQHYRVPGVSIAVIDSFSIAWAKGYGSLRSGGDAPVTAQTLFHAGSIAKPVSAAATLTLVQQGKINLDEDVNNKLSSWEIPESEFTKQEKVTLRRLLSHSAGVQDGFTNRSSADAMPNYVAPGGEKPSITIEQLLNPEPGIDVDGPTHVTAVPGSQYRYANADYVIVELLIRDLTGKPFPIFMQETVLRPLRMTSSTYEQPLPTDLRVNAIIEHGISGKPVSGDRLHFPMLAAGGLWTTPSDLARFTVEIMGAYHERSERIVSHAMSVEMLSKQIEIEGNPLADAAGLGFKLSGEGKERCIMHTGATWGSKSILWAYPETGQGVIIMTNSARGSLLRIEILL
ncbi:MAG: serine hydrolase domain-containing protein, partial [Planctomycetota bacterium]